MEMIDIATICFIVSYALLFISAIILYLNMKRLRMNMRMLRNYMEYYELCAGSYLRMLLSHEEYPDEPEGVHMDASMFDVSGNKVKRT